MRSAVKIFLAIFLFAFIPGARADDDVDIAKLYKEYAGAIVTVASLDSRGQESRLGTGFIVKEEGVIVTNYHVVAEVQLRFEEDPPAAGSLGVARRVVEGTPDREADDG